MGAMILTQIAIVCLSFSLSAQCYTLQAQNPPYFFSISGTKVFPPTPSHLVRENPVAVEEQSASRYSYPISETGNKGGVPQALSSVSSGPVAAATVVAAATYKEEPNLQGNSDGESLAHSPTSYSSGPLTFDYNRYTHTPIYGDASQPYKFADEDTTEPRTFDKFSSVFGKYENSFTDGSVDENKIIDSFNHNGVHEAQEDEEYDGVDARGGGEFGNYESTAAQVENGPHQIETIETKNYHQKVPAFDIDEFKGEHNHGHSESHKHGEVHYHQHKHMHKHDHKQEHVHKHKQEHKHVHDQQHKHAHQHGHKHGHEHNHGHKHGHEQKHGHKHSHNHGHNHGHKAEHKHNQVHKHEHHQDHKHGHEHKHDHHQDHKHDHNHGHNHGHKHEHHQEHKHDHQHGHKHGHKNDHQHGHKHGHNHGHTHGHNHGHKHNHSKH